MQWVPDDIDVLWVQFPALSSVLKGQFPRAGNVLMASKVKPDPLIEPTYNGGPSYGAHLER